MGMVRVGSRRELPGFRRSGEGGPGNHPSDFRPALAPVGVRDSQCSRRGEPFRPGQHPPGRGVHVAVRPHRHRPGLLVPGLLAPAIIEWLRVSDPVGFGPMAGTIHAAAARHAARISVNKNNLMITKSLLVAATILEVAAPHRLRAQFDPRVPPAYAKNLNVIYEI